MCCLLRPTDAFYSNGTFPALRIPQSVKAFDSIQDGIRTYLIPEALELVLEHDQAQRLPGGSTPELPPDRPPPQAVLKVLGHHHKLKRRIELN